MKLKFISSSLFNRSRKEGTCDADDNSGSYPERIALAWPAFVGRCCPTCIYSIGLSSPISRFAIILLAGNAFGVMFRSIRRREFVMTREVMETIQHNQSRFPLGMVTHTSILVFQMESRTILWSTSNISHNVAGWDPSGLIRSTDDLT